MESVNLRGLLSRATPHECWRAPIHPRLRLAAIASGPSILICLAPLFALLTVTFASLVDSFRAGDPGAWLLVPLCGLLGLLAVVDVAGLTVYIPMLLATRGLREGRPHWHWAAFGEGILGAIHGFFVALGLAMVVLAAIIWLVMICLFLIAAIVGLLGMGAGSSN